MKYFICKLPVMFGLYVNFSHQIKSIADSYTLELSEFQLLARYICMKAE